MSKSITAPVPKVIYNSKPKLFWLQRSPLKILRVPFVHPPADIKRLKRIIKEFLTSIQ